MKVEKVVIKEFKILENFETEVQGNHILIMGDNGVGKSSLIQFMEIALGKQTNVPPMAKGEGTVFVNKDGQTFQFGVKLKDGKPVVTVTSPDGLKDSRKGTIAGIVGAIEFNIDEFCELSKTTSGRKKQVEIFKSFLPADVKTSLNNYEAHIKASYDERTEVNRLLKEKEGYIKTHRLYPVIGVQKFEYKEMKELLSGLKTMHEANQKFDDVVNRFNQREKEITGINQQIIELQDRLATATELQEKAETWLKQNPSHKPEEIAAVELQLENLEKSNKDYTDAEALIKEIELVKTMAEEVGELTAKIDSSKEAVANTIRDMDGPIAGLSFDDETLVYNGVPVHPDSLSTSEIIELGIRLKMAENENLGILFIQRAESIGAERFKLIKEIADKSGWQLIAEQVERGNKKLHVEIMTDELIS